ncbi:MAG: outer membrane lipoprotein-sorting protein [Candidatus Omnitrophica bacterium]|nr:outer membrane lipoprotein-sorting protein [Candidatus Omnitrophota bacterium]
MKKIIIMVLTLGICGLLLASGSLYALELKHHQVYAPKSGMSVEDIMQVTYFIQYTKFAYDYQSTGYVYLIEQSGAQRKRTFLRQRIVLGRAEDNLDYKDVTMFTGPTSVKGLGILSWTYLAYADDPDQWLWIPSLKKVRKISASSGDDSFLGSDFTTEEITTRKFEDETYALTGEERFVGYTAKHDEQTYYQSANCYVIEARPKRDPWYYSKRVVWIDKKSGGDIYQEVYDAAGRKYKTIFKNYEMIKVEGRDYPAQALLECIDLRSGHRTVVEMKDIQFDQGLEESSFSERILRRSKW